MTYAQFRAERCEGCAKGNKRIEHSHYGARHIIVSGESWDESEHVPCTAPSAEAWAEELSGRIEKALGILGLATQEISWEQETLATGRAIRALKGEG